MPQADIANDYDRSDKHPSAWQNNPDFGKLAQLRIDFDGARMLLDDDVVAENGLNIFSFTSGVMPVPLSRILISTRSSRFLVEAVNVGS